MEYEDGVPLVVHEPPGRSRASKPKRGRRKSSDPSRPIYMSKSTYWGMVARYVALSFLVVLTAGLIIWGYVVEGETRSQLKVQNARMAQLNAMLWEKCTPQASPPTVYKDSGIYLLADPSVHQFPLGWTSAAHRCLPWDPESTGDPTAFGIWFDGSLVVGDGKTLQANRISPTYSDPAYLTRWTSFPLTVGVPARCAVPSQIGAFYLVLQINGAPLPCLCTSAGELCYHYPDPEVTDPVFLNDNKQVP